jgi:hypothetical protein
VQAVSPPKQTVSTPTPNAGRSNTIPDNPFNPQASYSPAHITYDPTYNPFRAGGYSTDTYGTPYAPVSPSSPQGRYSPAQIEQAQRKYAEEYQKVITENPKDPYGYYKDVAPMAGKPALNVETIGMTGYANIPGAREQIIGSIVGQYITPEQRAILEKNPNMPGDYFGGSFVERKEERPSTDTYKFEVLQPITNPFNPLTSSAFFKGEPKASTWVRPVLISQASPSQPVLGIGATAWMEKGLTDIFAPATKHLPEPIFSFSSGIAKGVLEIPTTGIDIITALPQTGGRAVERVLAVTTPYGLLPQGQKAREEGVADIGKGFMQMGTSFITNPFESAGRFLGARMGVEFITVKIVKPMLETKVEGEVNAVVMKTAPEGTDITNLVAVEGKYNVETSIGGVRVAGKKINIEGLQSSVELPTPKAYGGGTATVSEAGYTPAGGIVKTDVLAGTFGTAGGKEFVDVGALSKLPRMEFPATVSEAGYHAGLIIPEETAARFSTIGRVAGGDIISSQGLMVRAGEIALPGVQYNRFFSYADLSGGAKGTVFSDILVKQLTGTAGGTEGTFTPGGLIEISKSMQGTVIQAGAAQQAGVLGTIQAGGLGLGLAGEGLQLKSGVAGMLGFTEPLKYATVSTQQITQAKTATETKTIPVVSLGQAERTAQVSLEGIMPAGTTATRTAELTKIIPATSIWEGTSSLEKTMPVNILKPAEVEKVMPASSMFQGQVEVQIPMTASLTKTITTNILQPIPAPFTFEPPKPIVGGGRLFPASQVPKSGFRGLKQFRGMGSPLPFADILSVQRTQMKFGGRSTELPITGKTLGKWREAAGAGFGRGFPTLELSRRKGRKKKRTRRLI